MAGKLLKFLPKPTSFSINPNGSNTSNKPSAVAGFSGPIVSIVPKEARRTKKKTAADTAGDYEDREPTSPKVSCIGQVKNGDKEKKQKKYQSFKERKAEEPKKKAKKHQSFDERRLTEKKGSSSGIKGMFRRKGRAGRPPAGPEEVAAVPEVGRMRRYASGRETLRDFDWRAVAAAVGPGEEKEEEEEEKVVISHSGPILMGGGAVAIEKKKEVNIWQRRTLTAPVALQV